jgi:hypothetical protein
MEDSNSETFACIPTPCCQDCQACGFNASIPCFNHDPTLCNYDCLRGQECTLGNTPFDTGYTIEFSGRTEDAACCGAGGGECTCFGYAVAAGGVFALNDFILGVTCPELQLCSDLSAPPCLDSVQRDGTALTSGVFITDSGLRNPYTGLYGIVVTGLNIQNDFANLNFVFQGHVNTSSLPISYSASTDVNEQHTCLIDSITGPDCLDCVGAANPLQSVRKHLMEANSVEDDMMDNSATANHNFAMGMMIIMFNLFALGAARN